MALHWLLRMVSLSFLCFLAMESNSLVCFLVALMKPFSSLKVSQVMGSKENSSVNTKR